MISPFAALLVPAVLFAALGLMNDAPGEWGQGALIAWTGIAAALLAGAAPGAGALAAAPALLGFAAIMIGGPPGLGLAAAAVLSLLLIGQPAPRWLVLALAAAPVADALRQIL